MKSTKPVDVIDLFDLDSITQEPAFESSTNVVGWQNVGRCGFCVQAIEAMPRGLDVRHIGSGIPYGQCRQAEKAKC